MNNRHLCEINGGPPPLLLQEVTGYNLEYLHRNRHSGGILCYIHESLPYVRRQNLEVKSKEPPLIDNDEVINNPRLKAKVFNTHFASKSTIINRSDTGPHLEEVDTLTKLDKIYINKYELGPHIKEMKVSHQSPCCIPLAFLKILYGLKCLGKIMAYMMS